MKTVTITIPVSEAERLLDELPIAKYPRTIVQLLAHDALTSSVLLPSDPPNELRGASCSE